jgi:hypothetical protein
MIETDKLPDFSDINKSDQNIVYIESARAGIGATDNRQWKMLNLLVSVIRPVAPKQIHR